uniref:Ribonuclease 3-like protein 1 n=1 Tax=Noccaea caerulescens TaxID=107243 RepID=A0A1J3FPL7_NOCCA
MFLPPPDPSSIPSSSSVPQPPRKRLIVQRCENGSKLRKLNDVVEEEEENATQMESNITRAQDPQAGLMPHTSEEETRRVSAKGELYKLCSMRHWELPAYEWYEEGPCHRRVYVVKATIEVKEDSGTSVLECFGNPQHKKKIAAEEAAEAALWYLKNVGHTL